MDYTRQAKEVLKIAEKSAKEMAHPYVGTEHLLLGLRKVYTGVAAQVLGTNGVDEENIQKVMSELISPAGEMPGERNRNTARDWNIFWKTVRQRQNSSAQKRLEQNIC